MRTQKTIIILISGKAGSGKTTVSNILKGKLSQISSMTIMQYSFAQPIKKLCEGFMFWNGEKDNAGRLLLQSIGKDGRDYDQDVWVKHLPIQMDKRAGMFPFNFVLVDDWRFPNELAYLKKDARFDVVTVRVFGRHLELSTEAALDVSENSLPEVSVESLVMDGTSMYDFAVDNGDDDLNYLSSKLDVVLAQLSKRFILE